MRSREEKVISLPGYVLMASLTLLSSALTMAVPDGPVIAAKFAKERLICVMLLK